MTESVINKNNNRNIVNKDKNDLQIRIAHKSEAKKISGLVQAAFEDYNNGVQNPALQESLGEVCKDIEEEIVLVAEKDKRIVGSLRLEEREDKTFYLKRFSILPQFQDQGIGTKLVNRAKKVAIKEKIKYIKLHSTVEDERLVKFYQKLGFNCQESDTDNGYRRGLWMTKI